MNRRLGWMAAGLSCALVASIGANILFFLRGRDYYLLLNAVRLDPLGLHAYPVEEIASAQPGTKPVVVFVGDSRAEQWPAPAGLPEIEFVNRGIGSQTTAQVLERFDRHVTPLRPDTVVIQVGDNDLKTIPLFPAQKQDIINTCKANIRALVAHALASGTRQVILTTIFPYGQVPWERRLFWSDDVAQATDEVNNFITAQAGDRVTILDTTPILASPDGNVRPEYSQDLLHLKPAGYAALNLELVLLLRKEAALH